MCGIKYWEVQQSAEMISWIGKGLSKRKKYFKFNLTYYLLFKGVRQILKDFYLLLAVDHAHGRVFLDVPIIGFKNTKSLKDHLVRAALPQLDRELISKPCEGANPSCEVCKSVKNTTNFRKA